VCKNATEKIHVDFIGIDEVLDPKRKGITIEDMDQPNGSFTDDAGITKQGTISNKNALYRIIMRDYYFRTKLHKTRRFRINKKIRYRPRIKLKNLKNKKVVRNPIRATLFKDEDDNRCGQRISAVRRIGGYFVKILHETFWPP
jgi:hypothetical protein